MDSKDIMTGEYLMENLKKIKEFFRENHLAYISLSGKNELIIRDAFTAILNNEQKVAKEYLRVDAAVLNDKLHGEEGIDTGKKQGKSTRRKQEPLKIAIEFKSIVSQDIIEDKKFVNDYFKKILRDFTKNYKAKKTEKKANSSNNTEDNYDIPESGLIDDNTQLFNIIVVTHPIEKIDEKFNEYVKYLDWMNRGIDNIESEEGYPTDNKKKIDRFKAYFNDKLNKYFGLSCFEKYVDYIEIGNAFGTDVVIYFGIIELKRDVCSLVMSNLELSDSDLEMEKVNTLSNFLTKDAKNLFKEFK